MFENLEKGMIIQLYDNSDKTYIIVDTIKKNSEQFLVLNPITDMENKEIKLDYKEMVLIKLVNNEESFEFVTDVELVKELVTDLLNN